MSFCEDGGVIVLWLDRCDALSNLIDTVAGVLELLVECVLVVVDPALQAD